MRTALAILSLLLASGHVVPALAQTMDLTTANLEDLLKVEVRSVSKKEQQLFGTPAAVYVLTGQEIRRSGVTTVPDALRLVPGIQVAQIDANKWAVSARGFNSLWSNKLLVLVDGRVVYTPVSSGVYWDLVDVPLEDVERIEVVRGPGAAVWGANAVNGVINVITKASSATQGVLATVSSGTVNPAIATVRFGGALGTRGSYRLFAKHSSRGGSADVNGEPTEDHSRMTQAGFRSDFTVSPRDSFMIQGAALRGESGQRVYSRGTSYADLRTQQPIDVESPAEIDYLLARWNQERSSRSSLSAQLFVDRSYRLVVGKGEHTRTVDFEFQHRFSPATRHDLVWGAGHRWWSDREDATFGEFFDPPSSKIQLFNAFVEDEIALVPGSFVLTLGSKLERNSAAGFEFQPTGRFSWTPSSRQTVWAAVSRAARTPSRVERALHVDYAAFPGEHGQLTVLSIRGAADLASEHTTAIETGYRIEPRADLLVDIAAFHNRYSHLRTERRSVLFETTPGPPHLSILRQYSSGMSGESVGLETLVRWQVRPNWRLDAGYDWLHTTLSNIGDTPEATLMSNRNPEHQVRVKSWLTMGRGWQLDACVAYTGRLQSVDVPGYVRGDVRLGGPIARGIDLSVIGQNLLDPHHREFDGFEGVFLTHTRRNLSVRLTVDF